MDNRQLLLRGLPKIDELLLDEQLVFFYGIHAQIRCGGRCKGDH